MRTTTQRGYGAAHQQARRQALHALQDGDPCTRCHKPMWRTQARHLDLDHTNTRDGYLGLAHAHCNRSAGATQGNHRRRHQPQTRWTSRNWSKGGPATDRETDPP